MHLALQNAETVNRLVEHGEFLLKKFHAEHQEDPARGWKLSSRVEIILHEVEQLHDHQRTSCDTGGAVSICVTAAKRKFRIVKRENNIPVLGLCEYCNAEFAVDPETTHQPKDAHANLQKQFIAHKCSRLNASKNAARIVSEGTRIALSTSGQSSVAVAISRDGDFATARMKGPKAAA